MQKVVVVDHDQSHNQAVEVALQEFCEVVVLPSSTSSRTQDILDSLYAQKADIIILSIELPNISGYSLCNKIRKDIQLSTTPLILISKVASADTFEQHKKLKTHADVYLHKPVSASRLMQAIKGLQSPAVATIPQASDHETPPPPIAMEAKPAPSAAEAMAIDIAPVPPALVSKPLETEPLLIMMDSDADTGAFPVPPPAPTKMVVQPDVDLVVSTASQETSSDSPGKSQTSDNIVVDDKPQPIAPASVVVVDTVTALTLQQQLKAVQQRLEEREIEYSDLLVTTSGEKRKLLESRQQVAMLEKKLEEAERNFNDQRQRCEQQDRQIAQLRLEFAEKYKSYESKLRGIEVKEEQIQRLELRCQQQEESLEKYERENAQLLHSQKQMLGQRNALREAIDQARAAIGSLQHI